MIDLTLTSQEVTKMAGRGIRAVILFGSHAQNASGPMSDYDIFIIGQHTKENYDFIYDIFSAKIKSLVDIDIVFNDRAPMELQDHVARYGQVLYQERLTTFFDFRQHVMLMYSDFAPFRKIFQRATLGRISP